MTRFIPVYTGNTLIGVPVPPKNPVYPCVYREHYFEQMYRAGVDGLSLCIQGTRNPHYNNRRKYRFIPVYTGNTLLCLDMGGRIPVYPCVYREHAVANSGSRCPDGLSLCIQGTQVDLMH